MAEAKREYQSGGKAIVFDVGTSTDLTSHQLIMGSTRNGMSRPHDELLAKTVRLGLLGGSLLSEQKVGIRKPISPDRKAKARKAAKAAAKAGITD